MSAPDLSSLALSSPVLSIPTSRVDKTRQNESGADQHGVTLWPLLSSPGPPRPPSMVGELWDPPFPIWKERAPPDGLQDLPASTGRILGLYGLGRVLAIRMRGIRDCADLASTC